MLKEEVVTRVVKETKKMWTCDVCGEKAHATCSYCKKDICSKHSNDEDGSSDYPDRFCNECYKKYRYFKDKVEPIYDKQLEQEYERIMKGEPNAMDK
jgi:hypothetical protein